MALRAPFTTTALWQRLRSYFKPSEPSSAFSDEPQYRGGVIAVCVVTSVLLWFIFTMQAIHTVILDLPVAVQNLPDDEALLAVPPERVRIQVEGEGIQILRLYYNPPVIPINASASEVNLEAAASELAKDVNLESASPRVFFLAKEKRVTRRIPIVSRVRVETSPGYFEVGSVRMMPDSVTVSGAMSIIEALESWPTESRHFRNVRDTLMVQVPLADTLAKLVTLDQNAVRLRTVAVEFTESERMITVMVPGAPLGQEGITLVPETIRVRYLVPVGQYTDVLRAEDFFATVSYDEVRDDTTGRVRPRLNMPDRFELREVSYSPTTLQYFNVLVNND